jgi:hypothetical protein
MSLERLPHLSFLAAATVLVALSFLRPELLCDDAFITFRYAENLAAGRGLVANAGEHVEGYSNLVHTLLLALGNALGLTTILAANILGAASGLAVLLLMPQLAKSMGSTWQRGAAAGIAFGSTASFQAWTSRGLETLAFTALVVAGTLLLSREVASGGPAGRATPACFGLVSVSRPEGVLYVAVAAIEHLRRWGWRPALRFSVVALAPWAAQLAFRLAYYGDVVPNTYHVKMAGRADRIASGVEYVLGLRRSGIALSMVLLLAPLVAMARRGNARPALLMIGAGLAFAVSSGGEGYSYVRFLVPVLPLMFLLASVAFDGRPGTAMAWTLVPLVLVSAAGERVRHAVGSVVLPAARGDARAHDFLSRRVTELWRLGDDPMSMAGYWLRGRFQPDALLAIADAGRIPYASGMRVLDMVGLMDRHIARLAATGRVDPGYVLGRDPDVIAIHMASFWGGGPLEKYLMGSPRMLSRYRLGHVLAFPRSAYYFFVRTSHDPPEPFVDLTGLVGASRAPVRAYFRRTDTTADERQRLAGLLGGGVVSARDIARLDREIRDVAARTQRGIMFDLPPGSLQTAIRITAPSPGHPAVLRAKPLRTAPSGARGEPWLEASVMGVTATASPGQDLELALPAAPSFVLDVRVRRSGPADQRQFLFVAAPEITVEDATRTPPAR